VSEISKETFNQIECLLNSTLVQLLYGGSTDAGSSELESVSCIFKTLKLLNLKVKYEEDTRELLEKGNIYKKNWIEGF